MKTVQDILIDAAELILSPESRGNWSSPDGCCPAINRSANAEPDSVTWSALSHFIETFKPDAPRANEDPHVLYWMAESDRERPFRATALLLAAYSYEGA